MTKIQGLKLAVLSILTAATSFGQVCRQEVSDPDGYLRDKTAVVSGVQEVKANGAEVRVLIIRRMHEPSAKAHYDGWVLACSELQDHNTTALAKNNLIFVFVAVESRKTGIYYGSFWNKTPLNDRWPMIQGTVMNPKFKAGDYSGGIAAGLHEIAKATKAVVTKPAPVPQTQPRPTVTSAPQTQQAGSNTWIWVLVLSVILASVIGYVVYRLSGGDETKEQYSPGSRTLSYSSSGYSTKPKNFSAPEAKAANTTSADTTSFPPSSFTPRPTPSPGFRSSARASAAPPPSQPSVVVIRDSHSDLLDPLNPLSPISPFNPMNQSHESEYRWRRRDPDPEPPSRSYDYGSSHSSGYSNSSDSSGDSSSSSSSSDSSGGGGDTSW